MAKSEVLIQLIVDGHPAWQIRKEVPRALCRKMTEDELTELGSSFKIDLETMIRPEYKPAEPEPAAIGKKRR